MGSKICVIILTIAMICSIIGFEGNRQQKQDIKAELSVAQSEIVSLQDTLNKSEADLQQKINENKKLESELTEANKTIDTFKNNKYKFVYLGKFKLTAYCSCEKCCGYWATVRKKDKNGNPIVTTASGAVAQEGVTIAVDTSKIPYGTNVYIAGYGYRIAQDCGGGVKGNHIDVYYSDHNKALSMGLVYKDVWILVKNS